MAVGRAVSLSELVSLVDAEWDAATSGSILSSGRAMVTPVNDAYWRCSGVQRPAYRMAKHACPKAHGRSCWSLQNLFRNRAIHNLRTRRVLNLPSSGDTHRFP
jgi:hypothetical protein